MGGGRDTPRSMQPGHPAQQDDEYARCGTVNLCLLCEALAGQRFVQMTETCGGVRWPPGKRNGIRPRCAWTGHAPRPTPASH